VLSLDASGAIVVDGIVGRVGSPPLGSRRSRRPRLQEPAGPACTFRQARAGYSPVSRAWMATTPFPRVYWLAMAKGSVLRWDLKGVVVDSSAKGLYRLLGGMGGEGGERPY
jgi:hypothetical protein